MIRFPNNTFPLIHIISITNNLKIHRSPYNR